MPNVTVQPISKFSRTLTCPPDKSITHRAVLLAAAACGKSRIDNVLLSDDCLATIDCVWRLGVPVEQNGTTLYIIGKEDFVSAPLYAANAGTAMRLLCGLLAPRRGVWTITGDESLSRRPMQRIIDPLAKMGAVVAAQNGKAPLTVTGAPLCGIDYEMPVDSAQVKSAILMAGLGAQGTTRVTERERTRDHTEILLEQMGVPVQRVGSTVELTGGQRLQAAPVTVAGDISSASFLLVCGLLTGGAVTVKNVGLNPTRTGLLDVFDSIGIVYDIADERVVCGERVGTVTVRSLGQRKGFRIGRKLLPRLIDEIPVLAVLACGLGEESVIRDADELRVKESDRLQGIVRLVRAFGGQAENTPDGLVISPVKKLVGGCLFDCNGDHRMAMAAAVAAAASERGGCIRGGDCVRVSYPDFWRDLLGESA